MIDKSAFATDFRVVQSVAFLQSLGRIYAAELTALGAFAPAAGPTAALDSQIDEVLRKGQGYELIAHVPADSSYGRGAYTVWRATPDSQSTRSR